MSDYIEVLDETDPGSNLVGDTLIHTDMNPLVLSHIINLFLEICADFNFTQTSRLRIDVEHLACLL